MTGEQIPHWQRIQNVVRLEAAALHEVADKLGENASKLIEQLLECRGRVIVAGMGKAGLIGRKAVATFNSTGTPSIFLHPAEAIHGDLGIVSNEDCLLALSNSGETKELLELLPHFRRQGVPILSLTGRPKSSLAKQSSAIIDVGVSKEAAEQAPAPTSSTTALLSVCDALAICLMESRGFGTEQFAIFHPGGSLGRKLLLLVDDLMVRDDQLPTIDPSESIRNAIVTISKGGLGCVMIVDADMNLLGIFTDGDLRRVFERDSNPLDRKIGEAMTAHPQVVGPNTLAAEALKKMEDHSITVIPVVSDSSCCVGAIHLHHLIRAGLA